MAAGVALQVRRRGCLDTCLLELRAIDEPSLLPYLVAAEPPVLWRDGLLRTAVHSRGADLIVSVVVGRALFSGASAAARRWCAAGDGRRWRPSVRLETLSHILAYLIEPWSASFGYHEALSLYFGQSRALSELLRRVSGFASDSDSGSTVERSLAALPGAWMLRERCWPQVRLRLPPPSWNRRVEPVR